jgi:hypothetical protein
MMGREGCDGISVVANFRKLYYSPMGTRKSNEKPVGIDLCAVTFSTGYLRTE